MKVRVSVTLTRLYLDALNRLVPKFGKSFNFRLVSVSGFTRTNCIGILSLESRLLASLRSCRVSLIPLLNRFCSFMASPHTTLTIRFQK